MSMDPSLALQRAVRARMIAASAVTALVPASAILDRRSRPEVFPCIILGEGISRHADRYATFFDHIITDIHVFTTEPGLADAKTIVGAMREAMRDAPCPWQSDGYAFLQVVIATTRFMRDPDAEHGHAVITIEAILQELAA